MEKFEKHFEKLVRQKFPYMYQGKIFVLENFVLTFPKTAEKITQEILKKNYANSRKALD